MKGRGTLFRIAPVYGVTPSALIYGITLWGGCGMKLRDLSKRMDYERILEEQRAEAWYRDAIDAARSQQLYDLVPAKNRWASTCSDIRKRGYAEEISSEDYCALMEAANIVYKVDARPANEKYNMVEAEALRVFREKMAAIQEKYSFLECYQDDNGGANESTPVS